MYTSTDLDMHTKGEASKNAINATSHRQYAAFGLNPYSSKRHMWYYCKYTYWTHTNVISSDETYFVTVLNVSGRSAQRP